MAIENNTKELNKKSDKQLIKMKQELQLSITRSNSDWGSKEEKYVQKKGGKQGENTKKIQQLRRITARINNILNQRGLSANLLGTKPLSKRRRRRLRGRSKNGTTNN